MRSGRPRSLSGLRLLLPTALAIVLFVAAIFAVLIPGLEETVIARKRETLRELTNAAWHLLDHFAAEAAAGTMSTDEAQRQAVAALRDFRYGSRGKDYLWITDTQPRMIMHPYVTALEGEDLSDYVDNHGNRLFVEFVRQTATDGEAFVEYYWQWKDDETRVVPKLSYVRRFEPWDWIVGTGIYVEDVRAEVARITGRLWTISLIITAVVTALLIINGRTALRLERHRRRAEVDLERSRERYRALVEASDEGVALVIDDEIKTANRTICALLAAPATAVVARSVDDLLETDSPGYALYQTVRDGAPGGEQVETTIGHGVGTPVPVLLSATRLNVFTQTGIILTVRDLAPSARPAPGDEELAAVVDAAGIAVLRCSRDARGRILAHNQAASRLLGTDRDLRGCAVRDLFASERQRTAFLRRLGDKARVDGDELSLRRVDGEEVTVRVWARVEGEAETGTTVRALVLDRSAARAREMALDARLADALATERQAEAPLATLAREPTTLAMEAPVRELVRFLAEDASGAVVLTGAGGAMVGIVTDSDLCRRVVQVARALDDPAYTVMTAPVLSLGPQALPGEGVDLLLAHGIDHLPLVDDQQRPCGLVCARDLLAVYRGTLPVLLERVQRADTSAALRACHQEQRALLAAQAAGGVGVATASRQFVAVADALLVRGIELALAEYGPAPRPFAFLVVGSQGRHEQIFATDQDNALVYADGNDDEAVAEWFLRFAHRVNELYHQAGFPYCHGEAMARNPKWCQPLAAWRRTFATWINRPEPQDLIDVNIFFDLRAVYGQQSLAEELRQHIFDTARERDVFFLQLAEATMQFKAPVGLFGNLHLERDADHGRTFNLKNAILPLVNFARLYALAHRIAATNTFDRLGALRAAGVLSEATCHDLEVSYEFLLGLRLRHQMRQVREDRAPDNHLAPEWLGDVETAALKRIFALFTHLQSRIRFDFARQS